MKILNKYDYDVLLVNPPALVEEPKFENDEIYSIIKSGSLFIPEDLIFSNINTGLLSIATYLLKKRKRVKIIDLSKLKKYDELINELEINTPKVIGVSSTCAFDYLEFLKCIEICKIKSPDSILIGGGQNVGPLGTTVFQDSDFIDILCLSEGEYVMEQLCVATKIDQVEEIPGIIIRKGEKYYSNNKECVLIDLDELSPLKYEIYPNYRSFIPYVEESRGCQYSCEYCTNKKIFKSNIRIKSPEVFLEEVDYAISLWGKKHLFAFLASNFGVNINNTQRIAKGLIPKGIKWTTELRCDGNWDSFIDLLHEAGLRILNVGMETASKEILILMNKTNNPEHYIEKLGLLIEKVSSLNKMIIDINFILYLGETNKTLKETIWFLMKYEKDIDSIVCNPLFVSEGSKIFQDFRKYKKAYDCELNISEFWKERRIYLINSKRNFSVTETLLICNLLEKFFSKEECWLEAEAYHYGSDKESIMQKLTNKVDVK